MKIPVKIGWMMDLAIPAEERWAKRAWHKMSTRKDAYEARVDMEILPCTQIKELFLPVYMQNIMTKPTYRLNRDELTMNIERMTKDSSYSLMWFRDKKTGIGLGGNVIHQFPDIVKTAYRSYDHKLTSEMEMKYFDYYADYVLQEYVNGLGITKLYRGVMGHPSNNTGLILFKIRTGALPQIIPGTEEEEFDQGKIEDWIKKWGTMAYFCDNEPSGTYRKLRVVTKDEKVEVEKILMKAFGRMGIEVEVEQR